MGIELAFQAGLLEYIHLYTKCDETGSHAAFADCCQKLPEGLVFGMSRKDVIAHFDVPRFKGTGTYWAIYQRDSYGIRVGYIDGQLGALNLLSLASAVLSG